MREKGESAFDDVVDEDTVSKNDSEDGEGSDEQKSSESSNADTDGRSSSTSIEGSEPGFPFTVVDQHPMYIKDETWNSLQDTKYYTEGELLEDFSVRNVETREFDQAIAELVIEELTTEKIATKILENRGFES